MEEKPIIETICEGGAGGEAQIFVQARNLFPGIGGPIVSEQVVAAALRKEYSAVPNTGARLFLKHLILKKLDDYFCRTGKYSFPHIARPLGSTGRNGNGHSQEGEEEAYLYEWVYGHDGFSWEQSSGGGERESVGLDEWGTFVGVFERAGIAVGNDVTDAENGLVSQNIIHQLYRWNDPKLNRFWKRIDFGDRSLYIDHEKLERFFHEEAEKLKTVLGRDRYELVLLAHYVVRCQELKERDKGRLDILTREYRLSTLRHHRSKVVIQ